MPQKTNEREYRNLAEVLAPSEEEKIVRGYATTFNQPYQLYGDDTYEIWEKVDPNAFADTDTSDVIFQYDHQGRVYARTKNNTLVLRSDEHGLMIEANLGGTAIGRELYDEIKGGYTDKMSFGFTVKADTWDDRTEDGKTISLRTIKAIKRLYDVSAVSIPANNATEISVRNLCNGEIERLKAERLEQEKKDAIERKRAALIERCKHDY